MKKHLLSFFFGLLAAGCLQAQVYSWIGKWEATDNEQVTSSIEFKDSSQVVLVIPGFSIPSGTYRIDTSHSPMWLDITIKNGAKTATLRSLLEFVDNDHLKWQVFFSGERPLNFTKDDGETLIILNRKK